MQKTELMIKKRLNDLKRLSQNLKQSTQTSSQVDLTLVRAIFDLTRTNEKINSSASSPIATDRSLSYTSIPLSKKSSFFIAEKPSIQPPPAQFLLNEQNIEPLFPDKGNISRSIPSNSKISRNPLPDDQQTNQLIELHEYNCKLQFELREMREKLRRYQKRQEEMDDKYAMNDSPNQKQENSVQKDDNTPYFRLDEKVELFFTKLSINKEDYNHVEHQEQQLKLTLDKLVIVKERVSSSKISRDSNSEIEKTTVQLKLRDLRQVEYEEDSKMIITFAQNQQSKKSKLFLDLKTPENMRRWDFAIYINNKIIMNLFTDKIFNKEKEARLAEIQQKQQKQQSVANSHHRSRSLFKQQNLENLNEKQLLIRLTYYKEKFTDVQKKLKEIMVGKINESKKQNSGQAKIEGKQQKGVEKIELNDFFNFSTGNLSKSKIQEPQEIKNGESSLQYPPLSIKNVESSILYPSLSVIRQSEQQRQKQKAIKEKQLEEQRIRNLELEKQRENQKLQAAVNFLKRGIFMTKYSKSAYKPHEKRVFISLDDLQFCWQDKDSKQVKSVNLSDITSIQDGEIGEGISKHVNQKKLKNKSLYLLIKTKLKDRKTLQFGVANLDLLKRFIQNYLIFRREVEKGNFKPKS